MTDRKRFRFTNEEGSKILNQMFPFSTFNPKNNRKKNIMIGKATSLKNRKKTQTN